MKKNNILKVVLLAVAIAVLCTWLFPSVQYTQSGIETGERIQIGLFTITEYMMILFRYFTYVLLIAFSIGAFYGVAYKIPAYRALLDMIVESFKGKENTFLITIMVILAVITSITGLQLGIGLLFVFPLIISILLLMGYNKLLAASVTVGSVVVGLIGTTLGTTANDYINQVLGTTYDSEIICKVVLLVLGLGLLIYNVLKYAKNTKNETDKVLAYVPAVVEYEETIKVSKPKKEFKLFAKLFSKKEKKAKPAKKVEKKKETKKVAKKEVKKVEKKPAKKSSTKEAAKKPVAKKKAPAKKTTKKTKANDNATASVKVIKGTSKVKIWPFIVVFDVLVLIILLSVFNWSAIFNATWPTDALNAIKEFKLWDFPIFDKLLGVDSLNAFGAWNLGYEIPLVIFIFTGLLGLMYRVKFDKFIDGMLEGMKKAFVPALAMFLVYFVLIVCVQNLFQLHLTKFFLGLTSGLNVITMTIALMFSSIFNVEPIYIAQTVLPYITTVISDTSLYSVLAVMVQAVYGLMMLIAPTSAILIGVLSYLEIPYVQWIKHIWKLFLELLVVLLVVFLILVLI